jgi:putative DNA-invertase from lambdoid prophage Rac
MATYGYTRVSTGRAATEGQSLGVQERAINGHAMVINHQLSQIYVETGVSGSVPLDERPEGKKLLAIIQPGDTIITPKLDRMFRSADDALTVLRGLKKRGINLHLIDLGGDVTEGKAKFMFTLLAAVAEMERDRIRERITEVKADQRQRGNYLGGFVPFGMCKVVVDPNAERVKYRLEPVPEEQAVIAQIDELRAAGKSIRRIMTMLPVKLSFGALHNIINRDRTHDTV